MTGFRMKGGYSAYKHNRGGGPYSKTIITGPGGRPFSFETPKGPPPALRGPTNMEVPRNGNPYNQYRPSSPYSKDLGPSKAGPGWRRANRLARRAGRLARFATKLAIKANPYTRAFDFAWDLFNAGQYTAGDGGWSSMGEGGTELYVPPGWQTECMGCVDPQFGPHNITVIGDHCPSQFCRSAVWEDDGNGNPVFDPDDSYIVAFDGDVRPFFGSLLSNHAITLIYPQGNPTEWPAMRTVPGLVAPTPSPQPTPKVPTMTYPKRPPRDRTGPLPPYAIPGFQMGPRKPTWTPVRHDLLPPKGREKKVIWKPTAIHSIYGALTEIEDLIDAIADASPGGKCKYKKTLQGKAACIINEWDRIDWRQAALNALKDQIQDAVFGQFGQIGKDAAGSAGRHGYYRSPTGFQFGGGWWRGALIP